MSDIVAVVGSALRRVIAQGLSCHTAGARYTLSLADPQVINEAMFPIDVFWLGGRGSPVSSPVRQNSYPISSSGGIGVESLENHVFRIKLAGDPGHLDQAVDIVKQRDDETIIVAFDNTTGSITLQQAGTKELPFQRMQAALELCGPDHKDGFAECVSDQLLPGIERVQLQYNDLKIVQTRMANKVRNYTCSDPKMPTSTPIRSEKMKMNEKELDVNVFLDTSNAKIFAVRNFVSDSECDVLMRHGKPRLRRATVAALDGTAVVSESRKAQQASYDGHLVQGERDILW